MKQAYPFRPLSDVPTQYHLGTGLHTLGLLRWILKQTGRADVYVSTFSTSDAFLCGFLRLRRRKLIANATLVADLKAARKTVQLYRLMQSCFDHVHLAQNHSKIMLVKNESHQVAVISSQNQTYGDRAECTMITTDLKAYYSLLAGLRGIVDKSLELNGLFQRLTDKDRKLCAGDDDPTEISALLGIDERELCDDIATVGCPARAAYVRGASATALELRRTLHDTALAGSPYSIQECQRLLAAALSAVT